MANIRDSQSWRMYAASFPPTKERISGQSSKASAKSKTVKFIFLDLRNHYQQLKNLKKVPKIKHKIYATS